MRLYLHTVRVRVATIDPSPASTAQLIEAAITVARGEVVMWAADPAIDATAIVTVPDAPTTPREWDQWASEFVAPYFQK